MKHIKSISNFELKQSDFDPIDSFYIKDELNPKVWSKNGEINENVSSQLLEIANDFYNSTELNAELKDILLTGSLANYNWSNRYSDFDVHIVIDFNEVNDDIALVKKLVDYARNEWNNRYDIKVSGYEVEVYIENVNEEHISSGVYSILNDHWIIEPVKGDFIPNEKEISSKGEITMSLIDELEYKFDSNVPNEEFVKDFNRVWKKVKDYRASGLASESGEFSIGNLVFKFLRRNGYIGKLLEMRTKSYQNKFK